MQSEIKYPMKKLVFSIVLVVFTITAQSQDDFQIIKYNYTSFNM